MRLDLRHVPPRHQPAVLLMMVTAIVVSDWAYFAGARWDALGEARERLARQRVELAAARREVTAHV
ncbi:MAG TPA: hypothetical protein VJ829_02530, partial [Candidatus Binatia bacterium]|nr:hypothetical protein [Candidatus Binatia bacterium]